MSFKDTWTKFIEWAKDTIEKIKRKHMIENMEPKVLKEMMAELKNNFNEAMAIEDEKQKEDALKDVSSRLSDVEGIVDDVLVNVEKHIEESRAGMGSWLSGELSAKDYNGLQRGKATLLGMKEDLGKMKSELSGDSKQQDEGQSEPGV